MNARAPRLHRRNPSRRASLPSDIASHISSRSVRAIACSPNGALPSPEGLPLSSFWLYANATTLRESHSKNIIPGALTPIGCRDRWRPADSKRQSVTASSMAWLRKRRTLNSVWIMAKAVSFLPAKVVFGSDRETEAPLSRRARRARSIHHPTGDELTEPCERVAREALRFLDHFQTQLSPAKTKLPWP